MKFNQRFKEIISEWSNTDDDFYDKSDFEDYENPSDFEYLWDDLTLGSNDKLHFTIYMTAIWKFHKGSSGSYWEPAEPDTFEFEEGNEITSVNVYDEETGEESDISASEFEEKYPDAYEEFMEKYFNTEPDDPEKYPKGKTYPQSMAGKGRAVL